jgi:hypothetical protein
VNGEHKCVEELTVWSIEWNVEEHAFGRSRHAAQRFFAEAFFVERFFAVIVLALSVFSPYFSRGY